MAVNAKLIKLLLRHINFKENLNMYKAKTAVVIFIISSTWSLALKHYVCMSHNDFPLEMYNY